MNITPNNTLEGSRGLGLHATGNNIELNLVVSDDAAVWELVTWLAVLGERQKDNL